MVFPVWNTELSSCWSKHSSVTVVTTLGDGRPRDEIEFQAGTRNSSFFEIVLARSGAHTASCSVLNGDSLRSFSGGKAA